MHSFCQSWFGLKIKIMGYQNQRRSIQGKGKRIIPERVMWLPGKCQVSFHFLIQVQRCWFLLLLSAAFRTTWSRRDTVEDPVGWSRCVPWMGKKDWWRRLFQRYNWYLYLWSVCSYEAEAKKKWAQPWFGEPKRPRTGFSCGTSTHLTSFSLSDVLCFYGISGCGQRLYQSREEGGWVQLKINLMRFAP